MSDSPSKSRPMTPSASHPSTPSKGTKNGAVERARSGRQNLAGRGGRMTKSSLANPYKGKPASSTVGNNGHDEMRKGLRVSGRVHRACSVCRKQKMRCEGPTNGPCNRCRTMEQECVFERTVKGSDFVGNSERLDVIEGQVTGMQVVLNKLASTVQKQEHQLVSAQPIDHCRNHHSMPPPSRASLPTLYGTVPMRPVSLLPASSWTMNRQLPPLNVALSPPSSLLRSRTDSSIPPSVPDRPLPLLAHSTLSPQQEQTKGDFGNLLLPTASPSIGRRAGLKKTAAATGVSSSFDREQETGSRTRARGREVLYDRETDFPNEQLEAPIEALRSLASAAEEMLKEAEPPSSAPSPEQVQQQQGQGIAQTEATSELNSSHKRLRSDSGDKIRQDIGSQYNERGRDAKNEGVKAEVRETRRDVITAGLVEMAEAQRLWRVFGEGCPRYIGVFQVEANELPMSDDSDASIHPNDTFEATRRRSSFLFATILAIGGKIESIHRMEGKAYAHCLARAEMHAQETLFRPASCLKKEDVMALNLLASYCDSGWLICGHAVRVAQELRLDTYFPLLMKLVSQADVGKSVKEDELKELARGARIWFFTFLLEHQISYGTGRPAMLQANLVEGCRDFLWLRRPFTHPMDARFIATVELMVIRERHFYCLAPFDGPITEGMSANVQRLNADLGPWLEHWTKESHARGLSEDDFLLGTLRLQCATAKLYLTCTVLRKVDDEELPWDALSPWQRDITTQAVKAASETLWIAVHHQEYFNLLTWAPHYTVVTASFSAVFLLKAVRRFYCSPLNSMESVQETFHNANKLANRWKQVACADKYAIVIFRMLHQCFTFIDNLDHNIGLRVLHGSLQENRDREGGWPAKAKECESDWEASKEVLLRPADGVENTHVRAQTTVEGRSHGVALTSAPWLATSATASSGGEDGSGGTNGAGPMMTYSCYSDVAFEAMQMPTWLPSNSPLRTDTSMACLPYGGGPFASSTNNFAESNTYHSSTLNTIASLQQADQGSHSIGSSSHPNPMNYSNFAFLNENHLDTFGLIAHELDLGDTIADLFGSQATLSPTAARPALVEQGRGEEKES